MSIKPLNPTYPEFILPERWVEWTDQNSVEQGETSCRESDQKIDKSVDAQYDLIIIGAGPAGVAASLNAKKNKLNALTLEQDSLGGTVFTFPRQKIVMTSAMDLPLHGKVKLFETSKLELLNLWTEVLSRNQINLKENSKVESVTPMDKYFVTKILSGEEYTSRKNFVGHRQERISAETECSG